MSDYKPVAGEEGSVMTKFTTVTSADYYGETLTSQLRFAKYPDGSKRLQQASLIVTNNYHKMVWSDVPMVDVDENGGELMGDDMKSSKIKVKR